MAESPTVEAQGQTRAPQPQPGGPDAPKPQPGHLMPAAHGPPPPREHMRHLHAHPLVVVGALVAVIFLLFWAFKVLADVLAH